MRRLLSSETATAAPAPAVHRPRRALRAAGAALTLALAALVLVPASAHAGINGQHVSVEGVSQYSVKVCGDNENNTFVCTGIIATPTPVTNIPNYWWKGTILIEGYWDAHGQDYLGTSYCAVPTVWWSDWYNCNTGW